MIAIHKDRIIFSETDENKILEEMQKARDILNEEIFRRSHNRPLDPDMNPINILPEDTITHVATETIYSNKVMTYKSGKYEFVPLYSNINKELFLNTWIDVKRNLMLFQTINNAGRFTICPDSNDTVILTHFFKTFPEGIHGTIEECLEKIKDYAP